VRCSCCDKQLSDKEVIWNTDLDDYEICTICLDAALDAAFSTRPDDDGLDDKYILVDEEFLRDDSVREFSVRQEIEYD